MTWHSIVTTVLNLSLAQVAIIDTIVVYVTVPLLEALSDLFLLVINSGSDPKVPMKVLKVKLFV